MTEKSSAALREEWIDAFVKHVVTLVPQAPTGLLAARAENLYRHLGRSGPIEVAEAEWDDLPLGGALLS